MALRVFPRTAGEMRCFSGFGVEVELPACVAVRSSLVEGRWTRLRVQNALSPATS